MIRYTLHATYAGYIPVDVTICIPSRYTNIVTPYDQTDCDAIAADILSGVRSNTGWGWSDDA